MFVKCFWSHLTHPSFVRSLPSALACLFINLRLTHAPPLPPSPRASSHRRRLQPDGRHTARQRQWRPAGGRTPRPSARNRADRIAGQRWRTQGAGRYCVFPGQRVHININRFQFWYLPTSYPETCFLFFVLVARKLCVNICVRRHALAFSPLLDLFVFDFGFHSFAQRPAGSGRLPATRRMRRRSCSGARQSVFYSHFITSYTLTRDLTVGGGCLERDALRSTYPRGIDFKSVRRSLLSAPCLHLMCIFVRSCVVV
jgi:hypothetical protein